MGECNKDTTFEILDYFHEMGGKWLPSPDFGHMTDHDGKCTGNFIDT